LRNGLGGGGRPDGADRPGDAALDRGLQLAAADGAILRPIEATQHAHQHDVVVALVVGDQVALVEDRLAHDGRSALLGQFLQHFPSAATGSLKPSREFRQFLTPTLDGPNGDAGAGRRLDHHAGPLVAAQKAGPQPGRRRSAQRLLPRPRPAFGDQIGGRRRHLELAFGEQLFPSLHEEFTARQRGETGRRRMVRRLEAQVVHRLQRGHRLVPLLVDHGRSWGV